MMSTSKAFSRRIASLGTTLGNGALTFLFPPHCELCETPQVKHDRPVCSGCLAKIRLVGNDYCTRCGAPQGEHVGVIASCVQCEDHASGWVIQDMAAAGAYEGELASMVLALKFGKRAALARVMAAWLAQIVLDRGLRGEVIVPVPLGRKRQSQRGFNQAHEIARHLARHLDLPCVSHVLKRTRDTTAQAQLPRASRGVNVRDAFAPGPDARRIAGRHVLLVDDVMTTGMTINAAARVLLELGATRVTGVVVAR